MNIKCHKCKKSNTDALYLEVQSKLLYCSGCAPTFPNLWGRKFILIRENEE